MAGLFGLFGGKKNNPEEDPIPKDAFYLDEESAKSMGDTSYMKAPKSIRRTYPGTASQPEFEVTKVVSSIKASVNDSRTDLTPKRVEVKSTSTSYTPATSFGASSFGTQASSFSQPTTASEPAATLVEKPFVAPEVKAKRKDDGKDDGMDMFRNMAKNIRS